MIDMKEKVIIVGGPTASGKSDFALKLAKALDTEIISADSMQIYRSMDIGTAKVTKAEMDGIKHHMIDIIDAKDSFSVSNYVDMAREIISRLNSEGKVPIICGGTGLYIDALIYDFEFNNASFDTKYREELNNLAIEKGNEYIHDMLKNIDPLEAEKIHPNNVKRVIRALEICRANGGKKSENKRNLVYDTLMFVINRDRAELYDRINRRVDIMANNGLIDEIKSLLDSGITFNMQSMQAIGYKEWRGYIEGNNDIQSVLNSIKQNSRNYAKRQITWFNNKYKDIAHFMQGTDTNEAVSLAQQFLIK